MNTSLIELASAAADVDGPFTEFTRSVSISQGS